MGKGRIKQTAKAHEPHPSKRTHIVAPANHERDNPAWRTGRMDWDGPWSWSKCKAGEWESLCHLLHDFESMTWDDLHARSKPKAKEFSKTHLCSDAQKRLQQIGQDDLDTLCELRLGGAVRVWGIRDRNTFIALWWDPRHTVCPTLR